MNQTEIPVEFPMDSLEIPTDENDPSWRKRCNGRMEILKNIPSTEEDHMAVPQRIMIKLLNAVRDDGNVDKFADILLEAYELDNLPLSIIWKQSTLAGESLLHVAAEFGREKIAELIAYHYPRLLFGKNIRGDTALHVAARANNIHVIKVILFVYAKYGYASLTDKPQDKEFFLKHKNKHGNTALHEAVLNKHPDVVTFLLSVHSGPALDFYWTDSEFKTPMYLAVLTGDEKILRLLLQSPFPSRRSLIPTRHANSPLHAAILERNSALLQKIVDIREQLMYLIDENGDTPLHYAAYTGYVEGVRILLKKSTLSAFERNWDGNLPIHRACERGYVQAVKELLQLEYWPNATILLNYEGQNILHVAAMNGKNNVVKHLLGDPNINHEVVNERYVHGNTPLHLVSKQFCLWTLFFLSQDKRIDVNLVNNDGLTARDIVQMHSKFPMTRQELLSDMILRSVGVPLKANMLGRIASINTEWNVKGAANILILVAILIATVTFAAGFTVPGGVYSSDDPNLKNRGMAILAHETLFKIFMAFNMIAMYSSMLGSVIIIWVQLGDRRFAEGVYHFAKFFVYVALITMSVAFMAAIRLVVSNNSLLADVITVIGFIFIFFILLARILGRFPLGIHIPFFRQVGKLFIMIILTLFYGGNDILINQVVPVNQGDLIRKNDVVQVNQGDLIYKNDVVQVNQRDLIYKNDVVPVNQGDQIRKNDVVPVNQGDQIHMYDVALVNQRHQIRKNRFPFDKVDRVNELGRSSQTSGKVYVPRMDSISSTLSR